MKLYWSKEQMKWVEHPTRTPQARVHLQSDWEPVTSPITDEVIGGRRQYMDHLKQHGCHIKEAGQDRVAPPPPDREGIRTAVKESLRDMKVIG